jgi:hypothetical protein
MGDQDPAPSLSRRTLLTGGIAALTATAAATLPLAEEDGEAVRPFNYPSGGHGDWWPSYVAHAGTPARPDWSRWPAPATMPATSRTFRPPTGE